MTKKIPFNQLKKAGYNRPLNRQHVNDIKANFDEALVQPAIVSFRDGKYWIIDHQHQSQAIYELNGSNPGTPIDCDVRMGMTYEQEAELYYKLNTSSKQLKFNDKIIGLIEAKDEDAVKFRDMVEACGFDVVTRHASNSLNAVQTAWKYYNKGAGEERLAGALNLARECWPDCGMSKTMLEGLVMFLDNHEDEYQRNHFVKNLSKATPGNIVNKARAYYKAVDSRAFTQPYCTYTILVADYNRGLKNKLVPVQPMS